MVNMYSLNNIGRICVYVSFCVVLCDSQCTCTKTLTDNLEEIQSIANKIDRLRNPSSFCEKKNTVSFTVVLNQNHPLAADEKVPYNNVLSNLGNGYDVHSRMFTSPISGLYSVSVSLMGNPDNNIHLKLMKNGSELVRLWTQSGRHELASHTLNIPLKKNDQLWVQQASGSILWYTEPYNMFSAALISEEPF